MNILAVDDELPALESLEDAITEAVPDAEPVSFRSPEAALEYAMGVRVDVAFLDISMPGMSGLVLAKALKETNPLVDIIFTTAYSEYAPDAFRVRASGYLSKPVRARDIRTEMENLRNPVIPPDRGVRVRCFGSFEFFADGNAVVFTRPKAKEALAYLVDRRGSFVSKRELAAILWEDRQYNRSVQSHLHVLILEAVKTLKAVGADGIIIRNRGFYAVDTKKISCDYYLYDEGDISAINSYRGEYMSNYSWAEFTSGWLADKS